MVFVCPQVVQLLAARPSRREEECGAARPARLLQPNRTTPAAQQPRRRAPAATPAHSPPAPTWLSIAATVRRVAAARACRRAHRDSTVVHAPSPPVGGISPLPPAVAAFSRRHRPPLVRLGGGSDARRCLRLLPDLPCQRRLLHRLLHHRLRGRRERGWPLCPHWACPWRTVPGAAVSAAWPRVAPPTAASSAAIEL